MISNQQNFSIKIKFNFKQHFDGNNFYPVAMQLWQHQNQTIYKVIINNDINFVD